MTERTKALNRIRRTHWGIWAEAIVLTAVRPFLALLMTLEMCMLKDKDLSKVTPRYLGLCSLDSSLPWMLTVGIVARTA